MDIKTFGFYFLLFIILALAAKFYAIIAAFFPPIATAFVLAYLANPVYIRLHKFFGRKSFAALSVIVIVFILILVPATFVFLAIQKQVAVFLGEQTVASLHTTLMSIRDFVLGHFHVDIFGRYELADVYMRISALTRAAITALGPRLLAGITSLVLSAFLAMFLMYYLLVESDRVITTFRYYFPLSDRNVNILLAEIASHTRALILGQLLVAVIQGTLGAIGFLIFGIPGVILWGFVMTVLSFIPFLGSFLVWFPAGVIMLAHGDYFGGVGIMIWGSCLVGTIDNLIRPKLTSALGSIHPVTVLLGVFIGIKEWGFVGLVLGPIIISLLVILIRMFREEYIVEKKKEE